MNLGWLMETPISRASSEENRPRHADRAGVCAPNEEEEEEEQSSAGWQLASAAAWLRAR